MYSSYSFNSLNTSSIKYVIKGDTSYSISNSDTVSYNAFEYGIMLNFGIERFTRLNKNDCLWNPVNKSYACDCVDPMLNGKNSVSKIAIRTKEDFNATYTKGMDVTGLFVKLKTNYDPAGIIKEPLSIQPNSEIIQSTTIYSAPIYLNARPASPRNVQFDIEVTLNDGAIFTSTTRKIFLQ
jgi:hypothetical protein